MKRLVVVVGLLAAAPAGAENARDISPYTQALFSNMGLNWMCKDVIGIESYQAARTIATVGLAKYVGQNQAVLYVDQLDQKFRSDPKRFPDATAAKCYAAKADAMQKINVEKAKLEAE